MSEDKQKQDPILEMIKQMKGALVDEAIENFNKGKPKDADICLAMEHLGGMTNKMEQLAFLIDENDLILFGLLVNYMRNNKPNHLSLEDHNKICDLMLKAVNIFQLAKANCVEAHKVRVSLGV